jgi:hypothetical protein
VETTKQKEEKSKSDKRIKESKAAKIIMNPKLHRGHSYR